jgi:RNA polymerase sigma factor for flagellar operon FliA
MKDFDKQMWLEYKKSPSKELKDKIFNYYFPKVKLRVNTLCKKYPKCIDSEDVLAEVSIRVLWCIDHFDHTRNLFETYISRHVFGATSDYIRSQNPVSRVTQMRIAKIAKATKGYLDEHGHLPSDELISEITGLPVNEIVSARSAQKLNGIKTLTKRAKPHSGSTQVGGEFDNAYRGCEALDKKKTPYHQASIKDALARLLKKLPTERDIQIVRMYSLEGHTMAEIGEILDVCESRISQCFKLAMQILKSQPAEDYVYDK